MLGLPMQQAALQQLSAVPGVVGSMVFDRRGELVASHFPAVFDEGSLRQLAGQLAADGYFQGWLGGDQAMLHLRFADGTVVVRPVDGDWLMVLCTLQANPQLLTMSLTQVARRLRLGGAGQGGASTAEQGGHDAQAMEILAVADDDELWPA